MTDADRVAMQARREAEAERYGQWCEARDLDPYSEEANTAYDVWLKETKQEWFDSADGAVE